MARGAWIARSALLELVVDHQQYQVNSTAEDNNGGAGREAERITDGQSDPGEKGAENYGIDHHLPEPLCIKGCNGRGNGEQGNYKNDAHNPYQKHHGQCSQYQQKHIEKTGVDSPEPCEFRVKADAEKPVEKKNGNSHHYQIQTNDKHKIPGGNQQNIPKKIGT